LSVKEIAVYHYVGRDENYNYVAADEKRKWSFLSDYFNKTIHWKKGDCVYVYASVFAPTGFETDVKFVWYRKNKFDFWEKESVFTQHLIGGRDNGFRTKSKICKRVREGDWRVYLTSKNGAVIDRIQFQIKKIDDDIPLIWKKIE
jgi:hypothetical protein